MCSLTLELSLPDLAAERAKAKGLYEAIIPRAKAETLRQMEDHEGAGARGTPGPDLATSRRKEIHQPLRSVKSLHFHRRRHLDMASDARAACVSREIKASDVSRLHDLGKRVPFEEVGHILIGVRNLLHHSREVNDVRLEVPNLDT